MIGTKKLSLGSALSFALVAAVSIAVLPEPVEGGGEECESPNYPYTNYKIDRFGLPDPHGDTNLYAPPPNEGWVEDHTDIHDFFHHNDFQDDGYSHDHHPSDVCDEGGDTFET